MTQRVFDIENEKDMQDLWDILPDDVVIVVKDESNGWLKNYCKFKRADYSDYTAGTLFNINWHDKTEITRPIDYESMIGCVGWFWDNDDDEKSLGVLTEYIPARKISFVKGDNDNTYFNFRPAKKSELKFWEE